MADSGKSCRLDYDGEGFQISWDEDGLNIRATDYHAKGLHLPWDLILDLAKRASENKCNKDNGQNHDK